MSDNRAFFHKAVSGQFDFIDIFSDIFKSHSSEESARLFMSGTSLTTPKPSHMLSMWSKPYIFVRIFFIGLMLTLVSFVMGKDNDLLRLFAFIAGSFLVPVSIMVFFWEMNIPRNISFANMLLIFLVGGVISLVVTLFLYNFQDTNDRFIENLGIGIIEEVGKIVASSIWLRKKEPRYILSGMLIGSAVGAGFAAIESVGYAVVRFGTWDVVYLRAMLAIGGHVSWSAVSAGALAWAKKNSDLSASHFVSPTFLTYFLIVILLHFSWDYFGGYAACILCCIIVVCVAFTMIRQGVIQAVQVANSASGSGHGGNVGYTPNVPSTGIYLCGTKGYFAGRRWEVRNTLRIGRNQMGNDLIYPQSTGVSGNHCIFMVNNAHVYVKDVGSRYGTYINGKRLTPHQVYEVSVGTKIYLGSQKEEFRIEVN